MFSRPRKSQHLPLSLHCRTPDPQTQSPVGELALRKGHHCTMAMAKVRAQAGAFEHPHHTTPRLYELAFSQGRSLALDTVPGKPLNMQCLFVVYFLFPLTHKVLPHPQLLHQGWLIEQGCQPGRQHMPTQRSGGKLQGEAGITVRRGHCSKRTE